MILYPSVVYYDQLLGACHTLISHHDTFFKDALASMKSTIILNQIKINLKFKISKSKSCELSFMSKSLK